LTRTVPETTWNLSPEGNTMPGAVIISTARSTIGRKLQLRLDEAGGIS